MRIKNIFRTIISKKKYSSNIDDTLQALNSLIQQYGKILEDTMQCGLVYGDITSLPKSKKEIKTALLTALFLTNDEEMKKVYKIAYVNLALFQSFKGIQPFYLKDIQNWNMEDFEKMKNLHEKESNELIIELREKGF